MRKKNILFIALIAIVSCNKEPQKPNVIYVFADQWRAQATGYAGDVNALTPDLDLLAQEGINFTKTHGHKGLYT